jgi:hypothetical protein
MAHGAPLRGRLACRRDLKSCENQLNFARIACGQLRTPADRETPAGRPLGNRCCGQEDSPRCLPVQHCNPDGLALIPLLSPTAHPIRKYTPLLPPTSSALMPPLPSLHERAILHPFTASRLYHRRSGPRSLDYTGRLGASWNNNWMCFSFLVALPWRRLDVELYLNVTSSSRRSGKGYQYRRSGKRKNSSRLDSNRTLNLNLTYVALMVWTGQQLKGVGTLKLKSCKRQYQIAQYHIDPLERCQFNEILSHWSVAGRSGMNLVKRVIAATSH